MGQEPIVNSQLLQAVLFGKSVTQTGDLRAKGITIPMTDLLVAQLAKRHDLFVLSFDVHFDQIPGVKHQRPGP